MSGLERIDYIYRNGGHYDLLFAGAGEDVAFWINQARRSGDPVLELGCGTGRIAIALAQQGFRMAGLDNSAAMLGEARKKSAAAGVELELFETDMRAFDLGKTFSLIILPNNALGHLLALHDFEACLASVKQHLAPGGKFVVDFFVPKMELLLDRPGERFPFSEYDDPDGRGRIVVTESYVYETDTQIKRVTTHYAIPGEKEIEGELVIRMYFPQELDALFKYNGFSIDAKYGTYDETPFDSSSEKQLVVCSVS
jgi:SAM-dependent methyltransferase